MSEQQVESASSQAMAQVEEGSLLAEILAESSLDQDDDSFAIAKAGVSAFISEMLSNDRTAERIDKHAVDAMLAELDRRIGDQVNEILHSPAVQHLESAWRGLKYAVDNVNFRENVKIELVSVTKDELREDFEDSLEVVKSGLYRTVYSAEYGTFGGHPYGLMCANYDFGPGAQDVELLSKCASVAAMAHAPFLTNAGPKFFGRDSFDELPKLKDLKALFEGPQYVRWNSFRDSDDARNVGMCLPRFLLRLPYGADSVPCKKFNFEEDAVGHHDRYLWGHSSIALTVRVADSFAKYRWCPNIIGPQAGGTVENLPLHHFDAMGEVQTKIPTEVQLTERREYELSEEGFIGLTFRKGADNACFFSANSPQRAKAFANTEDGRSAETNYRLGTQLPYLFVVNRLAHYLKVLQREQLGSYKERSDLERELNTWIGQYVVAMDNPSASIRAQRPLREAQVEVSDVPGQPGWYRCSLKVRPHFKYMGASFTLSLVGRLDK